MLLLMTTLVVVSSESTRNVLEDVFANGSIVFADYFIYILVGIIVISIFCSYLMMVWKQSKIPFPPHYSSRIPLIGSFIQFAKSPVDYVLEGYDKYGSCFTSNILGERLTFLIGPDAHEAFFRPNDQVLDQCAVYRFMTPVFGEGIVYDATAKRRAQQLQFMATGLRTSRLKDYVEKIRIETLDYFKQWSTKGCSSLKKSFSELTILTASRALMGDEIRENLFAEVSKLYHDLDGGTTALSFFFPYLPTIAHKKRDEARLKMTELFSRVIQSRRNSGKKANDILQSFMDSSYRDDPNNPIPDNHVVGLLIGLLFAGQHTSSITLTWTTMFILRNPLILERVLKEQNEVLAEGRELSFEALNEMKYLHSCIKETIRLRPPLIFVMRKALQNLKYDKFTIPKGDIVVASPAVAGQLEECWSNPQSFDPDRYLDDRSEETKKAFTYVGFGGGMHGCMGQQYAYLQVKTVLSVLFRQFSLEMLDKELPLCDYTALVVGPIGDCLARYQRLQN